MGLHTVTWLLEGEVVHHDSLGSEQLIRPGELNLMTAGHGIAHSEEGFGLGSGRVHAVRLWVAQPESTRHGGAAFEHHGSLPAVAIDHATCTVLVGDFANATSPARRDTELVGVDVHLRPGRSTVPLVPSFEYGAVAMAGQVEFGGVVLEPGHLAYLGSGHDEVTLDVHDDARMMLIGGEPFESRVSMFWNYVARTHDEIDEAVRQWQADDGRFGHVQSSLPRIPSPRPPWQSRDERSGGSSLIAGFCPESGFTNAYSGNRNVSRTIRRRRSGTGPRGRIDHAKPQAAAHDRSAWPCHSLRSHRGGGVFDRTGNA